MEEEHVVWGPDPVSWQVGGAPEAVVASGSVGASLGARGADEG